MFLMNNIPRYKKKEFNEICLFFSEVRGFRVDTISVKQATF